MKLITFEKDGRTGAGILRGNRVIPLGMSMTELIRSGIRPADLPEDGDGLPLQSVRLLAPIPHPEQDILCLGMNFADHTLEAARFHPTMVRETKAVYFSKRVNTCTAPGGAIPLHGNVTDQVDYEAEVAVILGRDASRVRRGEAEKYIFGYTLLNDVSARDLQTAHKQFYFGKSLDGFAPMGPCIVTADAFSYPPAIPLRCYVNGELRQSGSTADWIYGIGEVLEEWSAAMTLKAGTVISMGTPAGVGMGFTPPRYLREGDVVRCEADGIGVLENPVTA